MHEIPHTIVESVYNLLCIACDRGWPFVARRLLAVAAKFGKRCVRMTITGDVIGVMCVT